MKPGTIPTIIRPGNPDPIRPIGKPQDPGSV